VVALGLILLVLSGVFTLGVVLSNTDTTSAAAFGVSLSNVSIGGLFLAGAVAGLIFGLGLALMLAGAARKRSRRVQSRREVNSVRGEREGLAEENSRLQAELDAQRQRGSDATPGGGRHESRTAVREDVPAEKSGKRGLFSR